MTRGKNTIFINGRYYDAVTGLAMDGPGSLRSHAKPATGKSMDIALTAPATLTASKTEQIVKPAVERTSQHHRKTPLQKSKTLRRDVVKRPAGIHESTIARPGRSHPSMQTSPAISKFASHPHIRPSITAPKTAVHTPTPRPVRKPAMLTQVEKHIAPPPAKVQASVKALSSRELKQQLIAEKLASAEQQTSIPRRNLFKAYPKAASVMASCFALVILAGYFTYLNMPNLSVRVAAAQAGVDARFPEYRPDGYRFNGPIAYIPGEVSMKFQSNGGTQGYTVIQKNSSWDSQAVLDNYVTKKSESYLTYSEQGLTIYTFDSDAAWVNGGILYTIEGDAPLSNEQVLRIAASM